MTPKTLSLLFLLAPLPAAAGALSELLMAPALFEAVPVGSAVVYDEDRDVPDVAGMTVEDVADGRVRLEVVAPGEMRLVRQEGGEAVPLGTFPRGAANPLLLYFLETTVRVMAEATGGSPYYIRNRIREALVAVGSRIGAREAREADLAPFAARRQPRPDGDVRRPRDPPALRSGAAVADPRTFGRYRRRRRGLS